MTNRLWVLLVVPLAIAMSVPALSAERVLPVAVSENASKVLRVEDGRLAGIAAPLYRCVFDSTGWEFNYIQMPLARALFSYEHGEVAAVVPLARSEERDRYGMFAGPLIEVQYDLLSPEELSSFQSIDSMLYVLPRGHLGKEFIGDFVPGGFEVNSWEQVFSMLRLGRADLTVVPRVILKDIAGETGQEFHTLPAGVVPSSLYVSNAYLDTELDEQLTESVAACGRVFARDIQEKQAVDGPGPQERGDR